MRRWLLTLIVLIGAVLSGCALLPNATPLAADARQSAPPLQVTGSNALSVGEQLFRIIPGQSTASYAAQEKWLRWHVPTKAVAKTDDVEGELVLVMDDQPRLAANRFRVDLRTLVSEVAETPLSDRIPAGLFLSGRDSATRTRLDVANHPYAEFTAMSVEGLPARYVEGQSVRARVAGDLAIRGSTRPVVFETEAILQGDRLTGTATAEILMTDFGVEPPSSPSTHVQPELTIRVHFVATAASGESVTPSFEERHPKLDTPLATVVTAARERGTPEALLEAQRAGFDIVDGSIRVIVNASPPRFAAARAAIDAAGGQIEVEFETPASGNPFAYQVLLPVAAIEALADQPIVSYLRTPTRSSTADSPT